MFSVCRMASSQSNVWRFTAACGWHGHVGELRRTVDRRLSKPISTRYPSGRRARRPVGGRATAGTFSSTFGASARQSRLQRQSVVGRKRSCPPRGPARAQALRARVLPEDGVVERCPVRRSHTHSSLALVGCPRRQSHARDVPASTPVAPREASFPKFSEGLCSPAGFRLNLLVPPRKPSSRTPL
jgi:hypothetical protein